MPWARWRVPDIFRLCCDVLAFCVSLSFLTFIFAVLGCFHDRFHSCVGVFLLLKTDAMDFGSSVVSSVISLVDINQIRHSKLSDQHTLASESAKYRG